MLLLPASRFGRLLLTVAALLLFMAWWWLDERSLLLSRQKELIAWAQDGTPSDFPAAFAAPDYHDQWGYTPQEVAGQAQAIRYLQRGITITAGAPAVKEVDGDTAIISQRITALMTDGERMEYEFHFTWRQQSFWPWSWKLREVAAPGLEAARRF